MLTGDLKATREDPRDSLPSNAPPFDGPPERLYVAGPPEPARSRYGRLVPSTFISVAVHVLLAIGFVIVWRTMVQDLSSVETTTEVEIVHSIPGEAPKTKEPPAPKAVTPPKQGANPLPLPMPEGAAPAASSQTGDKRDDKPPPAAVEPPPEPKQAETKPDPSPKPNDAPETPKPTPPPLPAKPPDAPKVLTAPQADTSVATPAEQSKPPEAKPPENPKVIEPEKHSDADPNGALAAALPMASLQFPSPFRAMLSASGEEDHSREYKGAVYGRFNHGLAHQVAEEARQRGLQGQVVVGLTVGPTGAIADLKVVQSSGKPDVDATALDLVRQAAPFPPPPEGASQSFFPAIAFGGQ